MTCGIVNLSFFWEFLNLILDSHAAGRIFGGARLHHGTLAAPSGAS
ncbi:MAG: hypothetical protein IPO38_06630 [Rhodocyclaceae bacterium]|nr:hypothetical protein [Rhodocyclaceae bacterium]MBL0075022.1 hypothetical protein [Rhodocyclaceae bacterium]MBP6108757.1 hypothetical protein [Rhodocyclaceae bacterium]